MAQKKVLPPDAVDTIQELAPEARKARRQHSESDPKVLASRALTAIFKDLHEDGYAISAIAKAAGMTYHSVSARIKNG